jgi:hypothetical protein
MQRYAYEWTTNALEVARQAMELEPDARQKEVLEATGKRFLLNCSRQWGKSTTAALKAAHRAAFRAGSLVVLVSPTERQTGELFGKVSLALEAMGYVRRGDGRHGLSFVLPNGSRVIGVPGTEATVRGYSAASLVIVDEAARVEDDLYRSLRPMLAVSNGDLMLLSTPFGERGFFWREWAEGGAGWTRMRVTAEDCPRIGAKFLEEEFRSLGEEWFRQEYFCSFVGMANQAFRREWIVAAEKDGLAVPRLLLEGWR